MIKKIRDYVERKWLSHQFDTIFTTFEKIANAVYKAEHLNSDKNELVLKMWKQIYEIGKMRYADEE